MKFRVLGAICLSALAMTWTTGCSAISEKASEKAAEKIIEKTTGAEDVDIKDDGANIKIKGKDGEGVTEVGIAAEKIPDDFPKDFPVYDNAKVVTSVSGKEDGKTNVMVTFQTSDSVDKVSEFYKNELPKSGYEISRTADTDMGKDGSMSSLSVSKNGEDVGAVNIGTGAGENEDETGIMVMLMFK